MSRARVGWVRLLACFSSALLLAAVGMAVADRYLARDLILWQDLPFSIDQPAPDSAAWHRFAARQAYDLRELADAQAGMSGHQLRVRVQDHPPLLKVGLRTGADEGSGGLRELIAQYATQRRAMEAACLEGADAQGPSEPAPPAAELTAAWMAALEQQTGRLNRLQDDLTTLNRQCHELEAQLANLEQLVTTGESPAHHEQFEAYAAAALARVLAADEQLALWEAQREALTAGPATSAEPNLAAVAERKQLEAQIDLRRQMLAEQVRQTQWQAYRQEVEAEIRRTRQRHRRTCAYRDATRESLETVREQLASLAEMTRWAPEQSEPSPAGKSAATAYAARLAPSLPECRAWTTFSRAQYLVVCLLTLTGACLGYLLPVGGRQSLRPNALPSTPRPGPNREIAATSTTTMPGNGRAQAQVSAADRPADAPVEATPAGWYPDYDRAAAQVAALLEATPHPLVLLASAGTAGVSCRQAVNLAIALVRLEYEVTLVEAKPNGQELALVFDLEGETGLADVARGAPLAAARQATALNGLYVVTPGQDLQAAHFDESLWEQLRSRGDVALIYAPASLGTQARETAVALGEPLLRGSDAIFLLGPSGRGRRKVDALQRALQAVGRHVLGVLAPCD